MKFKKVLTLVLIFILAFALVGCGNQNTEASLANNLDKSTTRLSSLISSLEGVEYEDIIIDNISPLENVSYRYGSTQTSNKQSNVLQKTKSYEVGGLSNKKYNDNVIAAKAPKQSSNAKYVSNNGEKIDINRTRSTNRNNLINKSKNINKTYSTKYANNNNYCENGNCYSINNTNSQNSRYSYTSSYRPKYVNDVSENFSRNQLDNYLNSIEEMYDLCADCVCCDAEYKNELSKLQQNIKDCKKYCSKLRDGTIILTEEEIKDCYECIDSLTNCIGRLKSTKGNIGSKTTEILKNKDNFSNKVSSLKDGYRGLYNALESRLQYIKQCNDNINCVFDILSKSNVDMKQAEKNKSDESDILKEQEKLEKEQNALENQTNNDSFLNYRNNELDNTDYNSTIENNTNKNNNKITDNNNSLSNKNDNLTDINDNVGSKNNNNENNTNSNTNNADNKTEKSVNSIEEQNKNYDLNNNSNVNENTEQNNLNSNTNLTNNTEIQDTENQSYEKTNNQNAINNVNKSDNKPKTSKQIVTKRTQKTTQNPNNNNNTSKTNTNNQTASYPINNGVNYGYGYGYPNGYNGPIMPYGNNVPYPPRNIDTYKTIVKNTDTYKPNYVPNNTNNDTNTVEETTTTYEIENAPENNNSVENNLDNNENNNANTKNNVETSKLNEVAKPVYDVKD